uniref:Uncharacterized protein n=1 Tax=Salix viminalis TaxID=40686 RepID=A0A6N2NFP1_SALVM
MKRRKKKTLNYSSLCRSDASIDERDGFRNGVEIVKSFSDKHIDLLRPAARFYAASKVFFWDLCSR